MLRHDGFEAHIRLAATSTRVFSGHVDIYGGGLHPCRIALDGDLEHEAAIVALEEQSDHWIAARARGEAKGDSRFDVL